MLIKSLQTILFAFSILDSIKYKFLSEKISRLKSSREVSRKFINISIFYRVLLLIYSYYVLHDLVLIWSCLIALFTLTESFWVIYLHYPYKNRKSKNFKKPTLTKYIINSILPNKYRKKL